MVAANLGKPIIEFHKGFLSSISFYLELLAFLFFDFSFIRETENHLIFSDFQGGGGGIVAWSEALLAS